MGCKKDVPLNTVGELDTNIRISMAFVHFSNVERRGRCVNVCERVNRKAVEKRRLACLLKGKLSDLK